MKMIDVIKKTNKITVYDAYIAYNFFEAKGYEEITRNQMGIEIINIINQEPHLFFELLTKKEFLFLQKLVDKSYVFAEGEMDVVNELDHLFLIVHNKENWYEIYFPEEISGALNSVLKRIDWKEKERQDDINTLKLGFLKLYGILPVDFFKKLCDYYNIDNRFETPYLRRFFHFFEGRDNYYLSYDGYGDFEEVLEEKIFNKKSEVMVLSEEVVRTISKYDVNIKSQKIKKFYNFLQKTFGEGYTNFLLRSFIAACHLNQITIFTDVANSNFYSFINEKHDELLSLAQSAYEESPSAALLGYTEKEYLNKIGDKKFQNKAKSDQCASRLKEKDVDLFYKVYLAILDYANKKMNLFPGLKIYKQINNNPQIMVEIRNKLYENKNIFDQFVFENPYKFNKRELSVLNQFKYGKLNKYTILKYEKEFAVFLGENDICFGVLGLRSSFNEIISEDILPCMVETLLLPFEDKIIYDGLLSEFPIQCTNRMKNMLFNLYNKEHVICRFPLVYS